MSINILNGVDAARKLHLTAEEPFTELRGTILEQARRAMNLALECPHEARADAIGYARALRDVSQALDAAATGVPIRQVEKPGPIAPAGRR